VQPAGASFEGYPAIGVVQKSRILYETVGASTGRFADAPIRTIVQNSQRSTERLLVRAREVLPLEIAERALPEPARGACPCAGEYGGGAGGPPTPARLTLLPDSDLAICALLEQIATARCRIDLMMYGWEDDSTGREVAAALCARAQAGVQVRLLVDRTAFLIHNAAAARGDSTFLDALKAVPNIQVIEPRDPFFRLDHRKLAVIDDRVAWTGGMILTEVARRRWHNFAFLAEGPITASYADVFAERWAELGGGPTIPCEELARSQVEPNATVRLLRTDIDHRSLKDAIYHAVDHAQHHIYLENPYFSDEILTKKLVAAQARGVQVHAILTLRGNMRQLNQFESLTANRLLRGGAHVYLYPVMTHVKAMSIDGAWAYIGTGNFDELSLRNNREVALSVCTPEVVRALDQTLFLPDMAICEPVVGLLPCPRNRLLLEFLSVWY
jgi:cardiolipin synthase